MNIIERYICAYIVQATTGAKGEQPSWPYDVLRHTDAKTEEPMLQEVLDAIKQSNGDSLELRARVLEAVAKAVKAEAEKIREPKTRAVYSREGNVYAFSIWKNAQPVAICVCTVEEFDLAKEKILEEFPDVVFVGVNAQ